MAAYNITINGVEYSGETASAKDQYQAFHLAINSKLILGIEESFTDKGLVAMLMSMAWSDLQLLDKLLVKDKLTRDSDDVLVALNLFRDDPANYALLLGRVARENLRGFYSLSGEKSADAGE
jgi:hypothetical protein